MRFVLFAIVVLAATSIAFAEGSAQDGGLAAQADQKPDYVVTTITPTIHQIVKGQSKVWFIRTENNGTGKTNETSTTRVFIDGKWFVDIPIIYGLGTYPPSFPDYQKYNFDGTPMFACTENKNYNVTAIADANEEIDELDENNNVLSTIIECVNPPEIPADELPDYAITSYKIPSTWVVNQTVWTSLEVTNLGAEPTNKTWTADGQPIAVSWSYFYRSTGAKAEPYNLPSLKPGEKASIKIPAKCDRPGQFDVLVLINYVHFLIESDYENDYVIVPVNCVLSTAQNTTSEAKPASTCQSSPREISCPNDIANYSQVWNDSSGCPVKCKTPSPCKDGKPIEVECNETTKKTEWMENGCSYRCKSAPPAVNESGGQKSNGQTERQTPVNKPVPNETSQMPPQPAQQKGLLDALIEFFLSLLGMK